MSGFQQQVRELAVGIISGSRQLRWAIAGQIATSGANFATTLIVVRALGLEEFGRFSVCFLLLMIVRNFLTGLVLTPMSIIGPKLRPCTQPGYRVFLAANCVVFAFGSSALLYGVAVFVANVLGASWLNELALALVLANLTANGAEFFRRYLIVNNAPVWAFAVDVVRVAVQLCLLMGLSNFAQDDFSAASALYALALGGVAAIVVGAWRYGSLRWSSRLPKAIWPRHRNYIKWMTPGVALEAVQANAPMLIGSALLGETALGVVRAVQQVANVLNLPVNALLQVAPAIAARIVRQNGGPALTRFLFKSSAAASILCILSLGVIFPFAALVLQRLFELPEASFSLLALYVALNLAISIRLFPLLYFQVFEAPKVLYLVNLLGAAMALIVPFLAQSLGAAVVPVTSLIAVGASTILLLAILTWHRRQAALAL